MAITTVNSDSNVFAAFITKLIGKLSAQDRNFRKKTRFLMDNCSYHKNEQVVNKMIQQGLFVHFIGPYGFRQAAVELIFSNIKQKTLTEEMISTGKS